MSMGRLFRGTKTREAMTSSSRPGICSSLVEIQSLNLLQGGFYNSKTSKCLPELWNIRPPWVHHSWSLLQHFHAWFPWPTHSWRWSQHCHLARLPWELRGASLPTWPQWRGHQERKLPPYQAWEYQSPRDPLEPFQYLMEKNIYV